MPQPGYDVALRDVGDFLVRFCTQIRIGSRQSRILKRHITHLYRVLKSIMRTVSSELHFRMMENFIQVILLNARFF